MNRETEHHEPGHALGWTIWWVAYLLALFVGAVVAGRSQVDIGAAVVGLPLARVTGWIAAWRGRATVSLTTVSLATVSLTVVLVAAGLAAGWFSR